MKHNEIITKNHVMHRFEYSDQASREAVLTLPDSCLYQTALQLDTMRLWVIVNTNPVQQKILIDIPPVAISWLNSVNQHDDWKVLPTNEDKLFSEYPPTVACAVISDPTKDIKPGKWHWGVSTYGNTSPFPAFGIASVPKDTSTYQVSQVWSYTFTDQVYWNCTFDTESGLFRVYKYWGPSQGLKYTATNVFPTDENHRLVLYGQKPSVSSGYKSLDIKGFEPYVSKDLFSPEYDQGIWWD